MTRARLVERLRWGAVPLLLCAIAVQQVVLVQRHNLTPWKGGGFGMFSTTESGATRVVRVHLVARVEGVGWRELAVDLPPELKDEVAQLQQQPTQTAAEDLATKLTTLSWRESPHLDAMATMTPQEFGASAVTALHGGTPASPAVGELLTTPRAWIHGLNSSARFGAGRPIAFDRAVVEILQLRYDTPSRTMRVEPLVEAWGFGAKLDAGASS